MRTTNTDTKKKNSFKNTPINWKKIQFRSKLEKTCYLMLLEAGLKFQYEPLAITLVDEIEYPLPSYQKRGKRFGLAPTKDRKITYTPDFLGENWVIETKGYFTPVARLKWKLFKKWLIDNNLKWHLFMPTNVGQITECINIIRDI